MDKKSKMLSAEVKTAQSKDEVMYEPVKIEEINTTLKHRGHVATNT